MFERLIFISAAIATIGAFLIEAWRTWKEYRTDKKRTDDVEQK